jgi:hypothetical protein
VKSFGFAKLQTDPASCVRWDWEVSSIFTLKSNMEVPSPHPELGLIYSPNIFLLDEPYLVKFKKQPDIDLLHRMKLTAERLSNSMMYVIWGSREQVLLLPGQQELDFITSMPKPAPAQ